MLVTESDKKLPIPKHLKDVTQDWIVAVVAAVNNVDDVHCDVLNVKAFRCRQSARF